MSPADIVTIEPERLFALVHPYELDGRVGSHPLRIRGFSTMISYVLVEDDHAVLIGTGYSAHQKALLAQLTQLVGERRLSLVIPRVEFASMCNARPIADRFDVDVIYQRVPAPASDFLNFRPEFPLGDDDGLRRVEYSYIQSTDRLAIGAGGDRGLQFLMPDLRLLPANWAYDEATRTLFTGDMFSWVWHDADRGPWLLNDSRDDPTTPERVAEFMLHNRYWWLAGADTTLFREDLAAIFERLDIDVVAPDNGCVLRGMAKDRHLQMLDAFLASAPAQPSLGLSAGRWPTTGQL